MGYSVPIESSAKYERSDFVILNLIQDPRYYAN